MCQLMTDCLNAVRHRTVAITRTNNAMSFFMIDLLLYAEFIVFVIEVVILQTVTGSPPMRASAGRVC